MYLYNSGGRRSEADRTRYEQKKRKNETHTTVRSRTAVVHNIRGKAYPNMTASIAQRQQSGWLEERYRSVWLSVGAILSVCGTTLDVGLSNRGAKLYNSSTQYCTTAAEHVFMRDTGWSEQIIYLGCDADTSCHMSTSSRRLNQNDAEIRRTYKKPSGERDPLVIPWVRTTLGREEITLGASIRCWVHVYEYSSSGRRSKQTGPGARKKNEKRNAHDRT